MAKIKTEKQYKAACARVEALLKVVGNDTPIDDLNFLELDLISDLVADYEEEHFPVESSTLVAVIKLRMYEKVFDIDAQLDAAFGKEGTPERKTAEDRANAFFTGQIIEEARKKANMTQAELAEKIGTNKSYISRVENGRTEPKVSTFYRIASALGLNVELTPVV